MSELRSLGVFCGHATGADPAYLAASVTLGRILAARGVELVYGGGHMGMMGALAEAALESGGRVVGVIPDFLTREESAYLAITEMIVVDSMEARKRLMMDRADAFCVLPGGFGTMDEAFEVLTQKQLGRLPKPIVFVDIGGFFQPWKAMADNVINKGFAAPDAARLYHLVPSVEDVVPVVEAALAANGRASGLPPTPARGNAPNPLSFY
ncbi:MAG: TIGR00730 family Rossman fold protein [Alphaproteobacteria bacterium]|nr:TIGR00730 family Rossman fold protein [Alphaproteobacteria bacterium]